jgi:hypothetical protein
MLSLFAKVMGIFPSFTSLPAFSLRAKLANGDSRKKSALLHRALQQQGHAWLREREINALMSP